VEDQNFHHLPAAMRQFYSGGANKGTWEQLQDSPLPLRQRDFREA
jgi:hypothetical protein